MKIICLGDSITGYSNLKKYLKWSSILECMCDAGFGAGKIKVVNRGIGGDTTRDVLKRIQNDVLDEKPDIVVMLLGGNDAGQKIPRETARENLEEIVEKIKKTGAKLLLLQYHLLPNIDHPETAWHHLIDNNDLIASVAENAKIPLLDMAKPMRETLNNASLTEFTDRDEDGKAHWQSAPITQEHLVNEKDGVHLNPGGELVFAREVYKKLQSLGWLA